MQQIPGFGSVLRFCPDRIVLLGRLQYDASEPNIAPRDRQERIDRYTEHFNVALFQAGRNPAALVQLATLTTPNDGAALYLAEKLSRINPSAAEMPAFEAEIENADALFARV